MKNRVSPTFIAAGVVIGLSCFILLSMLFYDTVDYYERSDDVAAADGFRFSVANTFFKSLGVGAYFGWMVILGWGIVIFFREKVGDLALRGASLVVVIVSGAAMAALLGADQHGGSLGVAVGNILSAGLGSTFGAIIMIAIFGASFLYATDYGFFRYVRQAREAVAVMEVETEDEVEVEEDRPTDWSKLIDQTVDEVTEVAPEETPAGIDEEMEEELLAERPDEEETDPEDITSEDSGVIVTNFQAIETEDLDEDLLVSGESEEPVVVTTKPLVEIEEEADDALLTDEEPAESPAEETTSEVLLDEDLLLSDEVAETAREMLAAFETSAAPVVEETEEPEEEPAFAAGIEEPEAALEEPEPIAEEDEEEIPVATVEIVEEETESDEDVEILEAEPVEEEIVEEADEEPEAAVEETEESAEPVPGDVHSVFDALLGFPPRAEEEPAEPTNLREAPREEPSNGQMRSSSAAAPVAEVAPVEKEEAPVADEVIEEPGFILTDDVIVVESEVPEAETEAEAPTPVAEKPIVEEPVAREEIEREVVEEMQAEEFTGETFVEQVILVDERLDRASEDEEEAPLLPFMAEEEQPEPVPNAEAEAAEAEPEAEIPVLENVNETGKKSGVLRSIFSKKDKPAKRSGDPLLDESAALVIEKGRASVVFLQRRLDIGYTRASRLIDAMERNGLVGPLEESGSREVLMTVEEWEEVRG